MSSQDTLDPTAVSAWLDAYGKAWEDLRPADFVRLFTPDVTYYWTPFDEPRRGREELRSAIEAANANQTAVSFSAELIAIVSHTAVAHWSCSFERPQTRQRVSLDGIFVMEFADGGLCSVFREWWHMNETP